MCYCVSYTFFLITLRHTNIAELALIWKQTKKITGTLRLHFCKIQVSSNCCNCVVVLFCCHSWLNKWFTLRSASASSYFWFGCYGCANQLFSLTLSFYITFMSSIKYLWNVIKTYSLTNTSQTILRSSCGKKKYNTKFI